MYNIGFGTFRGTVTAAPRWGAPGRAVELSEALPQSYCGLVHRASVARAKTESDAAAAAGPRAAVGSGKNGDVGSARVGSAVYSRADVMFRLRQNEAAARVLEEPRIERMVGVVYDRPREVRCTRCLCSRIACLHELHLAICSHLGRDCGHGLV